VSLAVSSLRAYGLNEELLDEMSSVRATGLTFAPEAGTQRMRDVINKNITEEHVTASAERVFGRGWNRMKLYFMIGLPTERDEDVEGIVEFGHRVRKIGKQKNKDAAVTVSVSSHVPKPHTPFQWCAQDALPEIERKQSILRRVAQKTKTELRTHDPGMSHVEGWHSRGDRRMADVIEHAYRDGARFDSWDEWFSLERWQRAAAACGVDPELYMRTLPVSAHLPWDHIDVGLEDGFLLKEYRKALKDRLSPPCGKVVDKLLHATNVEDALAEKKRLVCYDCGVACDLEHMRDERIVFLRRMGAEKPRERPPQQNEPSGIQLPKSKHPAPRPWLEAQGKPTRVRLRFAKLGRAAFMSHLDLTRVLLRIVRRAGLSAIYSQGFHPKPIVMFSPALALGIQSLGEYVEISLGGVPEGLDATQLCQRLTAVAPEGLRFEAGRVLGAADPPLMRGIGVSRFAAQVLGVSAAEARARLTAFAELAGPLEIVRPSPAGKRKPPRVFDLRDYLLGVGAFTPEAEARFLAELARHDGWAPDEGAIVEFAVRQTDDGSAKPCEVVEAVFGKGELSRGVRYARLSLTGRDGTTDPLDLEAIRAAAERPKAEEANVQP
jgi:radical SAM-linked protein